MTERDGLFLAHILAAVADIESFTAEGRSGFMVDRKIQSAVVRQLQIIGEAVKNLSASLIAAESAVPWRQIAGARDRLTHAYFSVDLDAVWVMVEQDLPALRFSVERILNDLPADSEVRRPFRPARRLPLPGCRRGVYVPSGVSEFDAAV